jgi:hypothetical protein
MRELVRRPNDEGIERVAWIQTASRRDRFWNSQELGLCSLSGIHRLLDQRWSLDCAV